MLRRPRPDRAPPSRRGCTPRRARPRPARSRDVAGADAADRDQRQSGARRLGERARCPAAGRNARLDGVSLIGPSSANATRSPRGARATPRPPRRACADTREREAGRDARDVGGVSDVAAQVDAVRAHRQRDVDPIVDVERDARRGGDRAQRARQLGQRAARTDPSRAAARRRRRGERRCPRCRAARRRPRRSAGARPSRADR